MPGRRWSRALVLGFSVTSAAAARALLANGIHTRVYHLTEEGEPTAELSDTARRLSDLGAEVAWGPADPSILRDIDVVVPSPGIAPSSPMLQRAVFHGIKIISENELAWQLFAPSIIAVTGTNGKTTTTALISHILSSAGVRFAAGGNYGTPLTEVASKAEAGCKLVCETSSFQLEFIEEFKPEVALVLNVADDHYDWHQGYSDYLFAKSRITENQDQNDLLVVRCDEPCLSITSKSQARLAAFRATSIKEVEENALSVDRDFEFFGGILTESLVIKRNGQLVLEVPVSDIRLNGLHNHENVLAASVVALESGVDAGSVTEAITSFEGLPHRMSIVAVRSGVTFIDDSKATNPHATLQALVGLGRVVLVAGGRAKDLDLSVLLPQAPKLKGLVVMGEAAGELESIFGSSNLKIERAKDVEDAASKAAGLASEGDVVLLSPACSSVDQYSSYVERGERFVRAVLLL